MAKNSKFKGDEALDNAPIESTESTEPKAQTEAGAKISAAQKGVPKQRIIVLTQIGDTEPVEHASLCAAVVAHGLSKEVDWFTGRNALKTSDTWATKGKVWSDPVEGEERTVVSEYDVTFKLVSASWKADAAKAVAESTDESTDEIADETADETTG